MDRPEKSPDLNLIESLWFHRKEAEPLGYEEKKAEKAIKHLWLLDKDTNYLKGLSA